MSKRVVITGVGVISPVGIGKEAFWDAMMAGKNGIGRNVMAFQPPLVITEEDINNVLNALEDVITKFNY